jgi:hypothetical protein
VFSIIPSGSGRRRGEGMWSREGGGRRREQREKERRRREGRGQEEGKIKICKGQEGTQNNQGRKNVRWKIQNERNLL